MRSVKSKQSSFVFSRWQIVSLVAASGFVVPFADAATALSNGVAVAVSGAKGSQLMYQITVPAGASNLTFNTSGGSGDDDLYERYNALPTLTYGDNKSTTSGSAESISIASPQAGTYYVMVYGYQAYSGVSLVAKYQVVSPSPSPSASPSASNWVKCASENGTCTFSGTHTVRYGTGTSWVMKVATGSIACNNTVFGDPASGYVKECDVDMSSSPSPTPSPSPSPSPSASVSARNPVQQPFASNSIWNMPIGSGAVFKPANIPANQDNGNIWATWPGIDEEYLFLNPGSNPLMPVYFNANAWNGGDRCVASSSTPTKELPIPSNFYLNGGGNYGAVFLQTDHRTLSQFQPITRCSGYNYATGYMFAPDVDLYGPGISGTHGGSGLSSIGGSIRVGELRPGQQGPRHALKLNVYAYQVLYKCTGGTTCYRWPADRADSYATASNGYGHSPYAVNNSNPDMRMGALLAIPRSVSMASLNLQTEPGRQLFFTLQNYGAYIVDDGASAGIQISVEKNPSASKAAEFQADYGYAMVAKVANNTPWMHDMQALITHLQVVSNNSATSIGGGGTPLQPLAPAIAP